MKHTLKPKRNHPLHTKSSTKWREFPLCKKVLKVEGFTFEDMQNAVKEFQILHSIHHPCTSHAIAINTSEIQKMKK